MSAAGGPAANGPWAGLDGCRGGWALAVLRVGRCDAPSELSATAAGPWTLELSVHATFALAMAAAVGAGSIAVGVDMPVGMSGDGVRAADTEARALLGPRRSSVFPTPARCVLEARSYADALRLSRARTGKGLSKQAWNLVPKIIEVDRWVRPDHDALLFEVHPELAFARLAGAPLADPKRTAAGREARLGLLGDALGPALDRCALLGTGASGGRGARRGAAIDDLFDAAAVACSVRGLAAGTGTVLGDGRRDERDLPMRICF